MTDKQYKQFEKVIKVKTKVHIKFNFTICFEELYNMPDINTLFFESLIDKMTQIYTREEFLNVFVKLSSPMYEGVVDIKDYYFEYILKSQNIPSFHEFSFFPLESLDKFFQWINNTLIPEYTEYKKTFITYNL
jgi:hypothetical protein